jgi:hypothetical protein
MKSESEEVIELRRQLVELRAAFDSVVRSCQRLTHVITKSSCCCDGRPHCAGCACCSTIGGVGAGLLGLSAKASN